MGLLNYFKQNVKTKYETVRTRNPSPVQRLFAEIALEIICPTVEQFGFARYCTEVETHFTTITFRKDNQYIKISGSTYPTDYPYSYSIVLGDGNSDSFFEYDWNSISLRRLKQKIDPTINATEYKFPLDEEVIPSITIATKELLEYGVTFLKGDLTLFYETRSEHNSSREPYKISTADKLGNYTTTEEPKSVDQKSKYS